VTLEEARRYPGKNLITRAVGTEVSVQSDLFHVDLERGDCLLLCSDGLSNLVDDQEILFEVVHGADKHNCCQRLLDIAKNRGASDNVTCVLMQL
jgi:protein phosphatase